LLIRYYDYVCSLLAVKTAYRFSASQALRALSGITSDA
jgi:hypothetical protein